MQAVSTAMPTASGAVAAKALAQAVVRKLVSLSNNGREFKRIAGLNLENWTL